MPSITQFGFLLVCLSIVGVTLLVEHVVLPKVLPKYFATKKRLKKEIEELRRDLAEELNGKEE